MNDMRKTEGDINLSSERAKWQEKFISSDTQRMLDLDESLFFHQSMSTPCMNVVEGAEGIYLYDAQGRKYMDFHGNSLNQAGYANAYIIAAIEKQLHTLSFSPRRYTNEMAIQLAEMLTEAMETKDRYRVLFTTAGTASIGLALKMARKYTGKHKTVSLWDSFHGASLDAISVGGESVFRQGIGPLLPGCEHIMPYNSYRCVFGDCAPCGLKCLDYLDYIMEREGDVAAVLMETIRSTDIQIPPQAYYQKLRQICDKYGALLILDEIPSAFGKTGKLFAFQHYDIEPDILVIGKGMGGGIFPMSAVIAKDKLNVCGDISLGHYTHEKSPVGCAAAVALLEYMEENQILAHVNQLAAVFSSLLHELKERFSVVGDIRCIGLMGAIELVKNRETKEKHMDLAERVMYGALEAGLSFKVSQGNVLTLTPPLIISEQELREAISIISSILEREQ